MGELGLLQALRPYLSRATGDLVVAAPTDDAAVWRTRVGLEVGTCDTMVENVDFRLDWPMVTFRLLGRRLMAINLSDLAAMGARPRYALVSLCLPHSTRVEQVRDLYRGITDQAKRFGFLVAGGDLSAIQGPMVLGATLIGRLPPRQQPLLRSAARPGWEIAVTGVLGDAHLGLLYLEQLREGGSPRVPARAARRWVRALLDPEPRLAAGQILAKCGIRVAGDISDGVFREVARIAAASRVGAVIDAERLPVDRSRTEDPRVWTGIGVSEDFELMCAGPPARIAAARAALRRELQLPLTTIGRVTRAPGIRLVENGREHVIEPAGYEHFR